jgi:hypothetical protein
MKTSTLAYVIEGAGALAVLIGVILSVHHLQIALPVGLGAAAIYVGRLIGAGTVKV